MATTAPNTLVNGRVLHLLMTLLERHSQNGKTVDENGKTVNGSGADTDTMVASVRAYVHALNKLLVKREKTAPEALSA